MDYPQIQQGSSISSWWFWTTATRAVFSDPQIILHQKYRPDWSIFRRLCQLMSIVYHSVPWCTIIVGDTVADVAQTLRLPTCILAVAEALPRRSISDTDTQLASAAHVSMQVVLHVCFYFIKNRLSTGGLSKRRITYSCLIFASFERGSSTRINEGWKGLCLSCQWIQTWFYGKRGNIQETPVFGVRTVVSLTWWFITPSKWVNHGS